MKKLSVIFFVLAIIALPLGASAFTGDYVTFVDHTSWCGDYFFGGPCVYDVYVPATYVYPVAYTEVYTPVYPVSVPLYTDYVWYQF